MGKIENDWFADRLEIEKRWNGWQKRIRYKGLLLKISMPDRAIFSIEKEFILSYSDKFGGSQDVIIKKKLINLKIKDVLELEKSARKKLKIGDCSSCDKKALLDKNFINTSLICRKCVLEEIYSGEKKRVDRKQRILEKKIIEWKKKGFNYLLELWVHPDYGDDYMIESLFTEKPTKRQIQALSEFHGSNLLDYNIVQFYN